jgi:predicted phosphodiesterase
MRLGVISDLHSNIHALDAVLAALEGPGVDRLIVLGDVFGYYPWARLVWERLHQSLWPLILIKGNHDEMLLRQADGTAMPPPVHAAAIAQNLDDLRGTGALEALRAVAFTRSLELDGQMLRLAHGTPADPENGRLYPDDASAPAWLPAPGQWLLLGHTHYPLVRELAGGGMLVNPGSVGQPRDGDPSASFAVIDLQTRDCSLQRAGYDFAAAQDELRSIAWDERAIRALAKKRSGSLSPSTFSAS